MEKYLLAKIVDIVTDDIAGAIADSVADKVLDAIDVDALVEEVTTRIITKVGE